MSGSSFAWLQKKVAALSGSAGVTKSVEATSGICCRSERKMRANEARAFLHSCGKALGVPRVRCSGWAQRPQLGLKGMTACAQPFTLLGS